ncbi:hypothetical protein STEG23_017020 [Scotinomys teguina]
MFWVLELPRCMAKFPEAFRVKTERLYLDVDIMTHAGMSIPRPGHPAQILSIALLRLVDNMLSKEQCYSLNLQWRATTRGECRAAWLSPILPPPTPVLSQFAASGFLQHQHQPASRSICRILSYLSSTMSVCRYHHTSRREDNGPNF